MELKPIHYKKAYEKLIADKIIEWFWNELYKEAFEILDSKTVYNDSDVIRNAIEQGLIYYQDGSFYSRSGRFNNSLSQELEKLGARYSKYRKAYLIEKSKVPTEILWAIDTVKANTLTRVALLKNLFTDTLNNLTEKLKKLTFNTAVEAIMQDLQDRVYKNAAEKKIELITPKLTDFKANEIAKNYTNNLDFWIKDWTEDRIPKMRNIVGQMAIDGKSAKTIAEYLHQQWGVDKRHAKFLARNESAIATTSYLAAKYQEEGITEFKWHTNLDGRERERHKKLGTVGADGNGNIYRFDNPPIINEKTGQRGLPGQDYNCRCTLSPVINKEFWQNRKKLFKAQNSLFNKLKGIFNGKI